MIELFAHQKIGIEFLVKRPAAMLLDMMGLGKTRQALMAALKLYKANKIDRILVLAPAAVRISWAEEITKLNDTKSFTKVNYDAKDGKFYIAGGDHGICVC